MTDIPAVYLQTRLRYEPQTGKLFWRPRLRADFSSDRIFKNWNVRFADKEAFASRTSDGYLTGEIAYNGRRHHLLAHRVVFTVVNGRKPCSEIDHIDGDRLNNRIENLREASRAENASCVVKPGKNLPGVHRTGRKWAAQICINRKVKYLGTFPSEREAHLAYLRAADAARGDFSPRDRIEAVYG